MLAIRTAALMDIATKNGWVHETGRLAGTLNATQMALAMGVSVSTVTRAYDEGATGIRLLGKLADISGKSLDELVEVRPDTKKVA